MSNWNQIGPNAAGMLYAGGDWLFATNPTNGDLHQFRAKNDWPLILHKEPMEPQVKEVVTDGSQLYRIDADNRVFSGIITGTAQHSQWVEIRENSGTIFWGPTGFYATDPPTAVNYTTGETTWGNIWRYDGTPGQWTRMGGPGSMWAAGDEHLYGLTPNRKQVRVYIHRDNWPIVGTEFPTPLHSIYAGGSEVYAVEKGSTSGVLGPIYRYMPNLGKWRKIGTSATNVAVDGKGRIYRISAETQQTVQLYRRAPLLDTDEWIHLGTPTPTKNLHKIAVAGNQNVYVTDNGDAVWRFEPKGDLSAINWCYSLEYDKFTFYPVVQNAGEFVWRSIEDGSYHIEVGVAMGGVQQDYIKTFTLPSSWIMGMDPNETRRLPEGVSVPFNHNYIYYVPPHWTITHPDDTNASNNEFKPAKTLMVKGSNLDKEMPNNQCS